MVARVQPGNSFEHAAFDCAEEKVSVCAVVNFALQKLVDFAFVFRGGGPDAEFYGLGERGGTLWTLSSFALRITIPFTALLV